MTFLFRALAIGAVLLFASATAGLRAATIAENTLGADLTTIPIYGGQSFTTTSAAPVNNITFNFFSNIPATTAAAFGTGFLLSADYGGTPANLSAATPGFLGMAIAAVGFYTFAPSLTLAPGTRYFFYENALLPTGAISGGNFYSGGQGYASSAAGASFAGFGNSNNFRVTGTLVTSAVPETGTSGLLLPGAIVLFALRRMRPVSESCRR